MWNSAIFCIVWSCKKLMIKDRKKSLIGKILLFIATVIWGSSFFMLKNAIDKYPTYYVLALRFLVGAIILGIIFIKKVITLNHTTIIKGIILGLFLSLAYWFQTIGLKMSTPSKNAFLTATYCIIVPFISWLFFKKKPGAYNIIAGALCVLGIGLISLNKDLSIGRGEILTIISSLFFALQIVFISRYAKKEDMIQLLLAEMLTTGLIFTVLSLATESQYYPIKMSFIEFLPILYLIIFATVVAQLFQMLGQKVVPANEASLILSLEAVFGTAFSIIFYKEKLSAQLIAGFVMIFFALIISESVPEIIKKKGNKKIEDKKEKIKW